MSHQRVLHYYARYLEHPSGVTDALNHWALASREAGDEVSILCAKPVGEDRNELLEESLTSVVAHAGASRGTWIPIGLFGVLRRGDLLVLHEGWVLSNVFATLVARLKGATIIVMPHGVYEQQVVQHQRDLFGVRRALERWLLRRADAVHVFYAGERDVVRLFEPKVKQFMTVPNGAPFVSESSRWNGAGNYFLWVGRFDIFHKGLDNLLAFWARLPEPRPTLLMVGPNFGGGREAILDLIDRHGLGDSVQVRGRVTGDEKDQLLAAARAYLHPSRWESCSIMLLEAAAAGVPCLISSTIHAAIELEPLGVLRSTRFESEAVDGDSELAGVDRNETLGARAQSWAESQGGWKHVGPEMVRMQTELGLRESGSVK